MSGGGGGAAQPGLACNVVCTHDYTGITLTNITIVNKASVLGLQCAASICNPLIYWLPRAAADTVTTLASGYALVISIQ